MNIPNDDWVNYRVDKFIEYQHKVPPIHQAVLLEYARIRNISKSEAIIICWIMANTYSELTTMLIFEEIDFSWNFSEQFKSFWEKNSNRVQFWSAKKYIKMDWRIVWIVDWFFKNYWNDPFLNIKNIIWYEENWENSYYKIESYNKKCNNFWRFSSDLFLEIFILFQKWWILDTNVKEPNKFDWKDCANLTSWTFNLMYEDWLADDYDSWKLTNEDLKKWEPILTEKIFSIKKQIENKYWKQVDIPLFITKICSFRNLFKNSRYWWYHHDRQLENLIKYNKEWGEKKSLWKEILWIRRKVFDKKLLWEMWWWWWIRKERKKLWTTKWLTWVE